MAKIDDNILALVGELSQWGFRTVFSCGGHPEPREPGQWEDGTWCVGFSTGKDFMGKLGKLVYTLASNEIYEVELNLRWFGKPAPSGMLMSYYGTVPTTIAKVLKEQRNNGRGQD